MGPKKGLDPIFWTIYEFSGGAASTGHSAKSNCADVVWTSLTSTGVLHDQVKGLLSLNHLKQLHCNTHTERKERR